MKRCILRSLLLLLAAVPLQAEQAPTTPADVIFLWLAGGISSARIQRLAQTPDETWLLSCPATMQCTRQCTRALQKAGADTALIQSLARQAVDPKGRERSHGPKASRLHPSCNCSTSAAQIAALVHDKNFAAAEDKLHAALRDDAGDSSSNIALLHFVLGTVLRRDERFDEALDEFTESSRLMPGFPRNPQPAFLPLLPHRRCR